jgi:hypothetical protein
MDGSDPCYAYWQRNMIWSEREGWSGRGRQREREGERQREGERSHVSSRHPKFFGCKIVIDIHAYKGDQKWCTSLWLQYEPHATNPWAPAALQTTLMDVIAGRKTVGEITGDILVNGHPKDQRTWARVVGYVEQSDIHTVGSNPSCSSDANVTVFYNACSQYLATDKVALKSISDCLAPPPSDVKGC